MNQEEAFFYLQDRASKGFTVFQAVVLAELDGLHTPNANGDRPLLEDDPTQPVESYFEHVDSGEGTAIFDGPSDEREGNDWILFLVRAE